MVIHLILMEEHLLGIVLWVSRNEEEEGEGGDGKGDEQFVLWLHLMILGSPAGLCPMGKGRGKGEEKEY
jgi:hypothetical protein